HPASFCFLLPPSASFCLLGGYPTALGRTAGSSPNAPHRRVQPPAACRGLMPLSVSSINVRKNASLSLRRLDHARRHLDYSILCAPSQGNALWGTAHTQV